MINWKKVIIGFILAVILSLVFVIGGSWGVTIGFFLATIYVGYSVGEDYQNGAIHGTIVAILYSIPYGALLLILGPAGNAARMDPFTVIIILLISAIIKGAIGGGIGAYIKVSHSKKDKTAV